MSTVKTRTAAGIALAASCMVSLMAGAAEAQIGQPVRLPGAVITTDPTQIRWVFALGPERVAYVNAANEVYVHRVVNNRIEAFARYGSTTVGVPNNPIDYALAEDENSVIIITQRGDVFRHDMRRNAIGGAVQVPGAPVGTAGQEQVFMFMVGNQLINVTRAGEIWAHEISRGTIQAPRRLGRYAITAPAVPRHAFVIGRTVYVISDQGQIFAHDIHPELGEGRLLNRGREHADLGDANTRFVFVMGPRLIAINGNGEVWARDVSRLYPRRPIPPGQVPPGQAPPAAPQ